MNQCHVSVDISLESKMSRSQSRLAMNARSLLDEDRLPPLVFQVPVEETESSSSRKGFFAQEIKVARADVIRRHLIQMRQSLKFNLFLFILSLIALLAETASFLTFMLFEVMFNVFLFVDITLAIFVFRTKFFKSTQNIVSLVVFAISLGCFIFILHMSMRKQGRIRDNSPIDWKMVIDQETTLEDAIIGMRLLFFVTRSMVLLKKAIDIKKQHKRETIAFEEGKDLEEMTGPRLTT